MGVARYLVHTVLHALNFQNLFGIVTHVLSS